MIPGTSRRGRKAPAPFTTLTPSTKEMPHETVHLSNRFESREKLLDRSHPERSSHRRVREFLSLHLIVLTLGRRRAYFCGDCTSTAYAEEYTAQATRVGPANNLRVTTEWFAFVGELARQTRLPNRVIVIKSLSRCW